MSVVTGTITLSDVKRVELNRRAMGRAGRADDARWARILLLDSGKTWAAMLEQFDCKATRILNWTVKRKPVDGSTHCSTRKLAQELGFSHMMIARVRRKHASRPQRLDRYTASNDPDCEKKTPDIVGLCLNPPADAAIFCVDERRSHAPH
jgi:hypothetical protein